MNVSRPALKPLAIAIALAGAAPAYAVQFEFDNGVKGSVDTTISYGVSRSAPKTPRAVVDRHRQRRHVAFRER